MRRIGFHRRTPVLALVLITAAAAGTASATQQLAFEGWGVRGGFSSSPDQFVLGGHLALGELARNLRLTPNADIGFGDHLTVFTFNGDLTYQFPIEDAGTIYVGGALGLVFTKWDKGGESNTDLGAALVTGYEFPKRGDPVFVDLKVGISDFYPDIKIMVGYTFLH